MSYFRSNQTLLPLPLLSGISLNLDPLTEVLLWKRKMKTLCVWWKSSRFVRIPWIWSLGDEFFSFFVCWKMVFLVSFLFPNNCNNKLNNIRNSLWCFSFLLFHFYAVREAKIAYLCSGLKALGKFFCFFFWSRWNVFVLLVAISRAGINKAYL